LEGRRADCRELLASWGLVQAGVPAWWLLPLAVLYATVRSLRRAVVLEQ
jgi:fatty acid desaturase